VNWATPAGQARNAACEHTVPADQEFPYLARQRADLAALQAQFPGWLIWYVRLHGSVPADVRWCAKPLGDTYREIVYAGEPGQLAGKLSEAGQSTGAVVS
jgi:hypothetical protein